MNTTRKIFVYTLATIAFAFLFLLPIMGFMTTTATAGQTAESAAAGSGDYIFFIVQNNDVPLASAPSADVSSYIVWISLTSFTIILIFMYSSWYLSIRKNIHELCDRLSPLERSAYTIPQGFLHPVKSYQLAKQAEDTVASIYTRYM